MKQDKGAALGRDITNVICEIYLLFVNQGYLCSPCDKRVSAESSFQLSLRLIPLRLSYKSPYSYVL